MGAAISVIIAVYNVREYLPRFVQSLQRQTFKDFEALFIDDASTDDSAALVEGYAASDARFRVLRHPKNLGLGTVCNLGIRSAAAETICFADPDDLLPEHSLEVRHAAYKKYNAIVRACHVETLSDGRVLHHETRPSSLPEICRADDAAQFIGPNPFLCAHWTWLFPTGLLRRNNIFHGENILMQTRGGGASAMSNWGSALSERSRQFRGFRTCGFPTPRFRRGPQEEEVRCCDAAWSARERNARPSQTRSCSRSL